MGLPDPSFADEVDVTQECPVYVKPGCDARHVRNSTLGDTHIYIFRGNRRDNVSTKIMFDSIDFKEIQVVLGRLLGGI